MLEPIESISANILPQAIVGIPLEAIFKYVKGASFKLDDVNGALFKLDNEIDVAIRINWEDRNSSTIYFHHRDDCAAIVRRILFELDIQLVKLRWERGSKSLVFCT
jgi:hypothetical protein